MTASPATINDLKSRVGTARAKLAEAEKALEDAIASTCPAHPGDIIRSAKGEDALVRGVKVEWGAPSPVAVLRKKDGTFGARQAAMWKVEWGKYTIIGREPPK